MLHSQCDPLSAGRGGGGRDVEPPTKLSKRGKDLTGSQFLEEGFFSGGLHFSHKQ